MKKRIAFLTTQYREVKSGPGRFTEYLMTLPFSGLEILFFSQQIKVPGENEVPVPIPGWAQKIPFSSFFRAWFFARAVERTDRNKPFDFILAADYSMAMFLPESLLKKTVVLVNDDNFLLIYSPEGKRGNLSLRTSLSRKLGFFLERRVVRSCAIPVANSQYTKNLIERMYRIPASRVKLLYKAVDLSWFQFRERPAMPPKRFLFVKNDWKRGGLDLVLKALSALDFQETVNLHVAGIAPSEQDTIRQLAGELKFRGTLSVEGLVNREELTRRMNDSDVFINFSRQEALGVSCLEAMAIGLPVLASNAGGLKEVLADGEAGWMVPATDVAALIRTLIRMRENPEEMVRKAAFAHHHVDQFSVEHLRKNLEKLFEE